MTVSKAEKIIAAVIAAIIFIELLVVIILLATHSHDDKTGMYTLIEFAKFEVEIVFMAKKCNFDSNKSENNSVDIKKDITRGQHFFQRPNLESKGQNFKFYDFSTDLGYFAFNYSGKVSALSKKAINVAKRP